MLRRLFAARCFRGWIAQSGLQLLAAAVVCWSCCAGARGDEREEVSQRLAAGEFGPALQIANGVKNGKLRDELRGRIAAVQASQGARRASLTTAAAIEDDIVRQSTYNDLTQTAGGARGGGALADFDTLIDLITSTIAPTTWDDNGGPGAIDGFPGGVFVDARGLLKRVSPREAGPTLAELRRDAAQSSVHQDLSRDSGLRKVSLRALERELQFLAAQGRPATEAMRCLAGIHKLKYVFVYPESGDIVLAGPAGPWQMNPEGRFVHAGSSAPVLQLDDLVVVLRNAYSAEPRFGCSITPTEESLAKTQQFLNRGSQSPLKPNQRQPWLEELRSTMGRQNIDVFGIAPGTRAAKVLVEADYRMKLVGMGLEEGVLGVESFLDSIELKAGQAPPPMNVLRWWFTLNYDAIHTTKSRDAFEIRGQGVKVLSENELLTQQGKRVHTGNSDELTSQFAHSFTKHFPRLAAKYPIYAELRNVFDLALVALLIREQDLASQVGWKMTYFDAEQRNSGLRYEPEIGPAPREVDTIVNHRVIPASRRIKHVVAGVSGGVSFDGRLLVSAKQIKTDTYGLLSAEHAGNKPKAKSVQHWWWD